jgi:hypothetical protein
MRPRVAVLGGDARTARAAWPSDVVEVRHYSGAAYEGRNTHAQLEAAIRAGRLTLVVALTRWLGHASYTTVRQTAQRCGVRFATWPGSVTGLARALPALIRVPGTAEVK